MKQTVLSKKAPSLPLTKKALKCYPLKKNHQGGFLYDACDLLSQTYFQKVMSLH